MTATVPEQAGPGVSQVRLTDSTLRDGSHAMAHQFTEEQVRAVVHALDRSNVEVIEVSHGDGLGGSSFNYGFSLADEFDLIHSHHLRGRVELTSAARQQCCRSAVI